jgi:hypothetical protein
MTGTANDSAAAPPLIGLAQRCLAAGYFPVPILRPDAPAFVEKGGKRQKLSPGKQPHGRLWAMKETEVYGATAAKVARWASLPTWSTIPASVSPAAPSPPPTSTCTRPTWPTR